MEQGLCGDFQAGLAQALETMRGSPASVQWEFLRSAPADSGFLWRQPLAPLAGALLVAGGAAQVAEIGIQVMATRGAQEASTEELAATFQEVLGQSLGAVARSLSGRLGREVSSAGGAEVEDAAQENISKATWAAMRITIGETNIALAVGLMPALLDALVARFKRQPLRHRLPNRRSRLRLRKLSPPPPGRPAAWISCWTWSCLSASASARRGSRSRTC